MHPLYFLLVGILLPVIPVYLSMAANGRNWAGKSSQIRKSVSLAISKSQFYNYLAHLGICGNAQISVVNEREIIVKMNPCLAHSGLVFRLLISVSDTVINIEIHGFTSWYLPQNVVIRKHMEFFAAGLKLLEQGTE